MAFRTKANVTDHFSLVSKSGTPAGLEIKSGELGTTPGVIAEAEDEIGDVIATDKNGTKETLSNQFLIKGTLALATTCVLGTLDATSKALLTEVTITTSKGTAPTLQASGATMGTAATQGAVITPPSISVSPLHKAQILAGAFTLAGTGCKLNECSLKFSCNNTLGEVAGEIISHDVSRGMLEVTASVIQSGATEPTIEAAEGWTIKDGPSKTEPEGGHDMWTVTLTKPVSATPAA